jgi:transcriptional regulator with XRE-family HTH domain
MIDFDSEQTRERIGLKIKNLREEQGLSLRRLAFMVGMDHGYLCVIEKGQANATITSYAKIAIGLGVELKDLFDI